MPKRKLEELYEAEKIPLGSMDKKSRLQRQQVDGSLDQSKKAIFRALKIARGFERQKLGRRQKAAKAEGNDADIARLDAEVAALKSLDLATTAELHLYKSLLKIKTIASAPVLPQYVHTTIKASRKPLDSASANVQARLFKSGPVQESMTRAISGIRAILGIEEVKPVKKKRLRAKDYTDGDEDKGTAAAAAPQKAAGQLLKTSHRASQILPNDESGLSDDQTTSGEESEDDYTNYASRLAACSVSDSDSESAHSTTSNSKTRRLTNPSSLFSSPSLSPSPLPPPQSKTSKPSKRPPPTKSTTFLPSLSAGYFSGSESASDASTDPTNTNDRRKNRPGQQARRALWEKKFGKNANHVKAQPVDRDEGWDARKGARGGDERGKRGRGRGRGGGVSGGVGGGRRGGMVGSGANSDPVVIKKEKGEKTTKGGEGPLHPSWEAARKAKEQKAQVAFQGKRVVFD